MKKQLVVFLSVFCVALAGAQERALAGAQFKVTMLIEDGLFKNSGEIAENAKLLTIDERRDIYDDYKQDPTVAVIENVFIGCGLGSFLQGDSQGGWIGLCGDLAGLGLTIYGITIVHDDLYSDDPYTTLDPFQNKGFSCIMIGSAAVLAVRIFELIRPIQYTGRYNAALRSALIPQTVSFELVPAVGPELSEVGLALKIALR